VRNFIEKVKEIVIFVKKNEKMLGGNLIFFYFCNEKMSNDTE